MEMKETELESLKVFIEENSSKRVIAENGERFLLKLYGATTARSLDRHRYVMYLRSIKASSLKSEFSLKSLPPTSESAEQHSFRAYHSIQQNNGIELPPTDCGWTNYDGKLHPTTMIIF